VQVSLVGDEEVEPALVVEDRGEVVVAEEDRERVGRERGSQGRHAKVGQLAGSRVHELLRGEVEEWGRED